MSREVFHRWLPPAIAAAARERVRVYQLIDYPYLMSALTLPTGFLVSFVASILESVTDTNNHDIYSVDG